MTDLTNAQIAALRALPEDFSYMRASKKDHAIFRDLDNEVRALCAWTWLGWCLNGKGGRVKIWRITIAGKNALEAAKRKEQEEFDHWEHMP